MATVGTERPLVLRGATLVDGVGRSPRRNVTILVRSGRITAVGSPEEIGTPDGAEVHDLSGRWVIPGLIDMHVHIKDSYAPHFLAAGVTTVRNTGGSLRELHDLRTAPDDGPTPRVISADRIIDGPPGAWGPSSPWNFITESPDEARTEVRRQVAAGTDLVKVYVYLKPEVMQAVAEEASAHGVPVSCDLVQQPYVTIREAARMGIRWNEHASGFVQALYPSFRWKEDATWEQVPWDDPDSPELDALCREVVDLGLMLCPTIALFEQMGSAANPWWPEHPVARAAEPLMKPQWEQLARNPALRKYGRVAPFNQAVARAFRRAGGVVVAGTDTPAGVWTGPGVALHLELQLLVRNGWSPMEAIRAATSLAARAMNRPDLGVVRPGARADLNILTADPLADIRNTLAIERVMKGGRLYTPEEALQAAPDPEATLAKHNRLMAEYEAGRL